MLLVVHEGILYMLNVDVGCSDCMYNIGDDLCEHMHCCWVICSYIDDGFYIHIGDDYDIFVASWGDDLGDDWYHMHIGVVSKRISWI